MPAPWERAIILVDMNAFFASIEQRDHPELQGRAIGITNGATGTCIITCSYEARAWGIKTGMRLREARQMCPDLIQIPSRPQRYAEVSTAIMDALTTITPDLEIFSVDEAFLDVTRCQDLLGTPGQIAQQVKSTVYETSGLLCSVGVSGDKTTAKWAAKLNKPDGLTVVPPWEAAERLRRVPVTELCGIAGGIGRFLAERGVHSCGDMAKLPVSELGRRFGNVGRRIWLMTQGLDPCPVETLIAPPKSIGHGKVMPPNTTSPEVIQTYLEHMSFKIGTRLRRHQMVAHGFFIGLRAQSGWLGGTYHTVTPTDDSKPLMALCREMLNEHWTGVGVGQVQITALDPRPSGGQLELFAETTHTPRKEKANALMDAINQRYGEFALAPARLLNRSAMPNVIAPAWKPHGHRRSV
ncbi:MAG: DNA polymerase IV [Gammaproteobacteria bacterium]|nr:DNA polymerase IV [Gammaproteobacteria bacterium]MCW8992425.1 DNA polymerase IV [Gammaproteobacteria bacterium]